MVLRIAITVIDDTITQREERIKCDLPWQRLCKCLPIRK